MEIKHILSETLHTNLANGGTMEVPLDVEEGSKHYIWTGSAFVKGECLGEPKIGIPIVTYIPNLFHIMEIKEKTGIEPTIFVITGLGIGIAFLNVV
jgi:hypothetical protein